MNNQKLAYEIGWPDDQPFDPDKDANHDYAVLEWARKYWRDQAVNKKKYGVGFSFKWYTFRERLGSNTMYKIGDYARVVCSIQKT